MRMAMACERFLKCFCKMPSALPFSLSHLLHGRPPSSAISLTGVDVDNNGLQAASVLKKNRYGRLGPDGSGDCWKIPLGSCVGFPLLWRREFSAKLANVPLKIALSLFKQLSGQTQRRCVSLRQIAPAKPSQDEKGRWTATASPRVSQQPPRHWRGPLRKRQQRAARKHVRRRLPARFYLRLCGYIGRGRIRFQSAYAPVPVRI